MASESDQDSASAAASASGTAGGQSKRPPLNHQASDQSDANTVTSSGHSHPRPKHQKQHHVGRLHGRVPSATKGLHKQHHSSSRVNLAKKQGGSPTDLESQFAQRPAPHRRATSEVKLPQPDSAGTIPKSLSQSNLKRNRSHAEIGKRTKSADKLKRSSSGTGIHHKTTKSQVHFDLGSEDPEDEWVDASGSNSPYLSRKGSLNSSTHSSLPPGGSATNSRPQTPSASAAHAKISSPAVGKTVQPEIPPPASKTAQRKELLTARLLQRTSSHGASPQVSTDMAKATPRHLSPDSTNHEPSPPTGSQDDGLISRFVEVPSSGLTSEGSFYNPVRGGGSHRSEDLPRRPHSMANLSRSHEYPAERTLPMDSENSALVPKPARRTAAPPAITSRTQQKLNLQRASSSIEPGQAVSGVGGVVGAGPLIGIGDPGHDGGNSRDPRVGKLLERTGMEYLVVRRHQNPVVRSLNRLSQLPGLEKTKRIPRTNTGSTTTSRRSADLTARHVRNVSMPDGRQALPVRRTASVKASGAGSSFEGDDMNRLSERLSGSSLVGGEEEDGMTALLRNLWEKPMDLSASTD
ncbi:torc1 subunit tco89 domain-containing [Trichoderma cornu-damae]|uniref:Torc1 subunit tco89 domain-containing n=1 Tax=Trichoderma cornu-damae TaxID=654480 RepID=A0A9P8QIB4_9HYPO|nr:torc1 subunit tco89 domain-containing [Trichoderma cornu-damae]